MAGVFWILFLIALLENGVDGYELQSVVVLGRHSLRTPVYKHLDQLSPHLWPKWKESPGDLTEKGELLESFMGDYFSEWLKKERLLPDGCPSDDLVYVRANALQRTIKTAESFVRNAFKNCKVPVHHGRNLTMDPLFNVLILNSSKAFRQIAMRETQEKLDESTLTKAYSMLNAILNIKYSDICRENSVCDLTTAKDEAFVWFAQVPNIFGGVYYGMWAADAFLAEYYSGAPFKRIGWGKIRPEDLKPLTNVYNVFVNACFNSASIGKDITQPLIDYLTYVFTVDKRKFTMLVGHDANQAALFGAMGFKDYKLQNQLENLPFGGKIVFQKWYDKYYDRFLLKVNYVYQSSVQLRYGQPLSLKNPPKWKVLEIRGCDVDEYGYCLWDDFVHILKTI